MELVLLHSPLTGPETWRRLAPVLVAKGYDTRVPNFLPALEGPPPYYDKIVRAVANELSASTVLIAHSGAGALVPPLVSAAGCETAVFVDALLPHPGRAWFDTISPELKSKLLAVVRNGKLPPWTQWWPQGALAAMVGDAELYESFARELHAIPLAYFQEKAPSAELPDSLRCAYLQLSSGYDSERADANSRGWPVRRLPLQHLAIMTDPDAVADALVELINLCA